MSYNDDEHHSVALINSSVHSGHSTEVDRALNNIVCNITAVT